MEFYRLDCIRARAAWRRAEEQWQTLNELEKLLHATPLHHLRRQYRLRRHIRFYRKAIR